MRRQRSMEERFWAKVDKDGPVPESYPEFGNCWLWAGGKFQNGYGRFRLLSHEIGAHKAAFLAAGGDLTGGLRTCHTCDTRGCVRNDSEGVYVVNGVARIRRGHLFGGTAKDNSRDAAKKDRLWKKYDEQFVRAILSDWASGRGTQRTIAARYGLNPGTVNGLLSGGVWGHLFDELMTGAS